MAAVPDERAAQIADLFDMDEIEVRRGLGLWVPEEHRGQDAELDEQQQRRLERLEEARQAIWRRVDDPAERERLLDTLDREVENTARHFTEMARVYEQGKQQTGA